MITGGCVQRSEGGEAVTKADHDCESYAIHGALARNHHGKPVKECMKCGRWKPEGLGTYEWQPGETLQAYLRGEEIAWR